MGFLRQLWVEIAVVVLFIISIVLLTLGGFTKVEISPSVQAVFAVLDTVSLLVLAIKKLLQKKDTTNK